MTNLTLTKEDQEVQDLSSKNNYTIFELSKERAAELEASYQKCSANSATTCGTITPLPLQREITPPKPFPFEALGSVLGEAAAQMHAIIQAPDAICGHSLLAAAALALQSYADIHIDGRIHPLSLFMLTVAESGDRKSAVDTIALKPIRDYEKMLVKTYRDAKKGYKNKKDAWNKFRQEVLSNSQKENLEEELAGLEEEPEPPLEPILLMEEPTYEGIVKLFAVGQPSLGLFSDEGGRMFGGYGMSPDNLLKQKAKALGINPMEALNGGLYYVQGRVEMSAQMMNQLIRSRGHSIRKDPKSTKQLCILYGKRVDNGDVWSVNFSLEDAKRAGIYRPNSPWEKFPEAMCFARALSMLARQLFPDVIQGCYVEGEISEALANTEEPAALGMETITPEQAQTLEMLISKDEKYKKRLLEFFKIESFEELPTSHRSSRCCGCRDESYSDT